MHSWGRGTPGCRQPGRWPSPARHARPRRRLRAARPKKERHGIADTPRRGLPTVAGHSGAPRSDTAGGKGLRLCPARTHDERAEWSRVFAGGPQKNSGRADLQRESCDCGRRNLQRHGTAAACTARGRPFGDRQTISMSSAQLCWAPSLLVGGAGHAVATFVRNPRRRSTPPSTPQHELALHARALTLQAPEPLPRRAGPAHARARRKGTLLRLA